MQNSENEFLRNVIEVKLRFLRMYKSANAGHIGCSLSCTEMLTFLHCNWMVNGDDFVLSKGHAAASLYSVLAQIGNLTEDEIISFYKNGTYLAAHPPANKIKGIPFATGSLGHGLSLAAGFALGNKLNRNDKKSFCITSDGELNEGSIWEAAQFISHHKLTNAIWLIDKNNLQGFGTTNEVLENNFLSERLFGFGWEVLEIDGHNFRALESIIPFWENAIKPTAIICNTIKGNGWQNVENTLGCHYLPIKDDEYNLFVNDLQKQLEVLI